MNLTHQAIDVRDVLAACHDGYCDHQTGDGRCPSLANVAIAEQCPPACVCGLCDKSEISAAFYCRTHVAEAPVAVDRDTVRAYAERQRVYAGPHEALSRIWGALDEMWPAPVNLDRSGWDPRQLSCGALHIVEEQPGVREEVARRGWEHVASIERSSPTILGCRHHEPDAHSSCEQWDDVVPCTEHAHAEVTTKP